MSLRKRLFPTLSGKWLEVNFNELAVKLLPQEGDNPTLNPEWCSAWLQVFHQNMGVDYSYGGFLEDRTALLRGCNKQGIHVGVDYNVPVGTPVYLPRLGKLMMLEADPDQNGGWGHRAIYKIDNMYVLFAHLGYVQGVVGEAGSFIGFVGSSENNGGWLPHLHVQVMKNYNIKVDGYMKEMDGFLNPEEVL